jgi:hypothetical protein
VSIRRKLLCLLAVLPAVTGCASTRLYSVCQYAGPVPASEQVQFADSIRQVLFRIGISDPQKDADLLADQRYLVLRARPSQHKQLAESWPALGCLGRYGDSNERAKYAACMEYLRLSVASNAPGLPEDELLCFEAKNCPSRTPEQINAVIYCNGTTS